MGEINCSNCGKSELHHAKGMCSACYRRLEWKPKKIKCKRCEREKPMKAKGLCGGCYNFVYMLDYNKAWNQKKNYGINIDTYKKIIKSCKICGFDKVVDLHHLDENHKNNKVDNLIGLCPNHHKMLHDFRYRREMLNSLKEKGFHPPNDKKLDFKP